MNEKRHKIKIHKKAKGKRNYFPNRIFYDILNNNKYNIIKELNIQYDIEIDKYKNNYWGDISQPKTSFINRTSSLYNNIKKDKNIFKKLILMKKKFIKKFVHIEKNIL